jgi:Na+-exporting ATPase
MRDMSRSQSMRESAIDEDVVHWSDASQLKESGYTPHLTLNPIENAWDEHMINMEHLETGLSSWHLLPSSTVMGMVEGTEAGLTTEEAHKRMLEFGPNELEGGQQVTFLRLLIHHLLDFLMILLIVAAVVALAVQEWVDGAVILAIAIANVLIGVFQEYRAEQTLEALRGVTASMALALRDGKKVELEARELVPGDIVFLSTDGSSSGVAADMRVLECRDLSVVETTLTGESKPIHKSPDTLTEVGDERFYANMCYNGTTVGAGKGTCLVVRTGMSTELGKIAANVQKAKNKKTDLQRELHIVSLVLFCIGILFAIVVFAANSFHINESRVNITNTEFPSCDRYYDVETGAEIDINGVPVDSTNPAIYTAVYAIAMIIAIIPEELPLVLTLTMVLGVKRMTKLNVVVRQMSALENLGRVTDICSDKTGTITQASMMLTRAWLPGNRRYAVSGMGFNPDGDIVQDFETHEEMTSDDGEEAGSRTASMMELEPMRRNRSSTQVLSKEEMKGDLKPEDAALSIMARICGQCNGSQLHFENGQWTGLGQPTDVACRVFAIKMNFLPSTKMLHEYLFDSSIKRMTVVVGEDTDDDNHGRHQSVLCKGAVERIIPLCTKVVNEAGFAVPLGEDDLLEIELAVSRLASMGLRVLAFAARGYCVGEALHDNMDSREAAEHDMTLIGLGGLQDPPRPGVGAAVQDCRRGGINVRMLTGDHLATAISIARDVKILQKEGEVAIDAVSFDNMTEAELDQAIDLPRVVARCTHESKVKMVHSLHRRNRVVAMTGDGVNDAPALNEANIGVAMGKSGSDVTRQVASIVLSDDNFVTIVNGVREGRRIFLSIKKFVVHVLATNVGMVLLLMIGLSFQDPNGGTVYPQSALEILILNMYVLSLPLMGLVTEPPSYDVMMEPPRKSRYVLTKDVLSDIIMYGILLGSCAIATFTATLYGVYGGQIGCGCNSGSAGPDCTEVKRARGTTFLACSLILIFSAYNCRNAFEPVWRNFRTRPFNKVMFITSCIVFVSVMIFIYVPGLNTAVFHHEMVFETWYVAIAAFLFYAVCATIWKFIKQRIFKSLYVNARHLDGNDIEDEDVPLMKEEEKMEEVVPLEKK